MQVTLNDKAIILNMMYQFGSAKYIHFDPDIIVDIVKGDGTRVYVVNTDIRSTRILNANHPMLAGCKLGINRTAAGSIYITDQAEEAYALTMALNTTDMVVLGRFDLDLLLLAYSINKTDVKLRKAIVTQTLDAKWQDNGKVYTDIVELAIDINKTIGYIINNLAKYLKETPWNIRS